MSEVEVEAAATASAGRHHVLRTPLQQTPLLRPTGVARQTQMLQGTRG
jgi:hypothetical protein